MPVGAIESTSVLFDTADTAVAVKSVHRSPTPLLWAVAEAAVPDSWTRRSTSAAAKPTMIGQ